MHQMSIHGRTTSTRPEAYASRLHSAARPAGKREQPTAPRRGLFLIRLSFCGVLFAIIVALKLTMPNQVAKYRESVVHLLGEETDFQAAFSAVGGLIGQDAADVLDEAYQAVFGAKPAEAVPVVSHTIDRNSVVYNGETIPEQAEMLQSVLGFSYTNPVQGILSSAFGYRDHPTAGTERFHYGLDIMAEEGTVIKSFADGTVTAVGKSAELGNYLEVSHANGYVTLYAHCRCVTASSGQTVQCGDPIAEVGATGDATGNHLHFELHRGNIYLNPIYYVGC